MASVVTKCRAYLTRLASTEGASAFNGASFPWMLPIVATVPICYLFDLSGTETLWLTVPAGIISGMGIFYVGYILMREGPIATYRKNREQRGKRNDR